MDRTPARHRHLYFFLSIGVIIFAYDLYRRVVEEGHSWAVAYREYAPHFASEILITFIAVAILERAITQRERRHEIRGAALGGLRFYVRFCEQHDCRFTEQRFHWLKDEYDAFNSRKGNWIAQMNRTERALFAAAAQKVDELVTAVDNFLRPPDANVPADVRQQTIVDAADAVRTRYRACRREFWKSSSPDRIE
jgi:hypothetical protein